MSSIVRIEKRKNRYAQISNNLLRDKRLSWKARGVLAYLLSQPDDWEIQMNALVKESDKDGREALRSAFKELCDFGYAKLEYRRSEDMSGRLVGRAYVIYEDPVKPQEESPNDQNPEIRETRTSVKPTHGKPQRLSNTILTNTEENNLNTPPTPSLNGNPPPDPMAGLFNQDAVTVLNRVKELRGVPFRQPGNIEAALQTYSVQELLTALDWAHDKQFRNYDGSLNTDIFSKVVNPVNFFTEEKLAVYVPEALAWHDAGRPDVSTQPVSKHRHTGGIGPKAAAAIDELFAEKGWE